MLLHEHPLWPCKPTRIFCIVLLPSYIFPNYQTIKQCHCLRKLLEQAHLTFQNPGSAKVSLDCIFFLFYYVALIFLISLLSLHQLVFLCIGLLLCFVCISRRERETTGTHEHLLYSDTTHLLLCSKMSGAVRY